MTISQFTHSLINNPDQIVKIKGSSKKILGFAEFRTMNLGDANYFKIAFDDHTSLLIIPNDELVFYADEPVKQFTEIPDADIGNKKVITFRDKQYQLENKNDYQYVIRLIKGDYQSIEGEVKFSDYMSTDGSNDMLSLGWIVRTGERADLNPKLIALEDIA